MSQFGFDLSTTASGFIKGTFEKTTQKTTAPQTISFHRTPQREKHTHRRLIEITATPQIEILFTASEKHQHRNTANPQVPLISDAV